VSFIAQWVAEDGAKRTAPPFILTHKEASGIWPLLGGKASIKEVRTTSQRIGALLDTQDASDALNGAPKELALAIITLESTGRAFGEGWQPEDKDLVAISNRFESTKFSELTTLRPHDLFTAWIANETISLASTSWGVGQIMGLNHFILGYKDPESMVLAFRSPKEQIIATCRMVRRVYHSAGGTSDLNRIARLYNGPNSSDEYRRLLRAYYADSKLAFS